MVVGYSNDFQASQGFIWDPILGMRSLKAVLVDAGLDLTGWELTTPTAISPDGSTIVGYGSHNIHGEPFPLQAWIAVIPEPGTLVLLTAGLVGLGVCQRRLA